MSNRRKMQIDVDLILVDIFLTNYFLLHIFYSKQEYLDELISAKGDAIVLHSQKKRSFQYIVSHRYNIHNCISINFDL